MVVVYDIEVLKDFFLYLDYDIDTGEFSSFEISRFINELKPLLLHLTKIKAQIGYNNLGYDAQIIQHIRNKQRTLFSYSNEELTDFISEYSDRVIGSQRENRFLDYSEWKITIPQLDLMKVWHYDNKQRKCSLKWLEFSIDWHNLEDMPISHLDRVKDEETRQSIKDYCKNDVLATHAFYQITLGNTDLPEFKGKDKIKFRKDITKRLGVNVRNFSDVKIGDEINKINYLKATGKEWREIKEGRTYRTKFTFGDCFPEYTKFETPELKTFINNIKNIYVDLKNKQEFVVTLDGVEYCMAKGGLHSKDKPRLVKPLSHQILRDADVGSMYPNGIRKRKLFPKHLGDAWLAGYADIIDERLRIKAQAEETGDESLKSIVEAFKLALNGGSFGKTQDMSNWQYDPFVTFCVTIGCQIDLLMLIEDFYMAKIRIISANTDGVVVLMDSDKEPIYKEICKNWEIEVGNHDLGKLEYADYSLLAQSTVNDYIAIKKKDGKAKHKGDFLINYELHKNKSFRIVKLALDAYFAKGINPVKFITEHQNIFDFCAAVRAVEGWHFEHRGIKKGEFFVDQLPKTNRFYISNSGNKLIKCHNDGREIQVNAGKWMSTIYNKHYEQPISEYDINYDFYIEQTYNIISNIQPEITGPYSSQLQLF